MTREEAGAAPPRETGTPAAILLIETSDPERRAAVRARIEAILPAADALLVSPDPESFAQHVDAVPDRPILVVHTAPEAELGLVFRRTQHAARALTAWSNHAEALLKVLRRARRRSTVVEDAAFVADPGAWFAQLGLKVQASSNAGRMRLPEVPPITRLFGGAILRTDARALELAGELSASLEGADPAHGAIDLDAALAEILEGLAAAPRVSALAAEKERLDALLKASNEENAALLNQLISAQEALDAEARARRAAEKRVETLDRQLDEEQKAKRAATNRAEDLKRQLTEAKKERQAAEKRVVTLDRQLGAGQKAKQAAEANSRALKVEIDRILNSYSFRVTAPIRWVRRIASGQWKQ